MIQGTINFHSFKELSNHPKVDAIKFTRPICRSYFYSFELIIDNVEADMNSTQVIFATKKTQLSFLHEV